MEKLVLYFLSYMLIVVGSTQDDDLFHRLKLIGDFSLALTSLVMLGMEFSVVPS